MHEPHEENHLLMSVYPYEVPLIYMDSDNDNGMGGIDIIYKKEVVRKIPGKGGCQEKPISDFIDCISEKLANELKNADVKCKVPALDYTQYDTTGMFLGFLDPIFVWGLLGLRKIRGLWGLWELWGAQGPLKGLHGAP